MDDRLPPDVPGWRPRRRTRRYQTDGADGADGAPSSELLAAAVVAPVGAEALVEADAGSVATSRLDPPLDVPAPSEDALALALAPAPVPPETLVEVDAAVLDAGVVPVGPAGAAAPDEVLEVAKVAAVAEVADAAEVTKVAAVADAAEVAAVAAVAELAGVVEGAVLAGVVEGAVLAGVVEGAVLVEGVVGAVEEAEATALLEPVDDAELLPDATLTGSSVEDVDAVVSASAADEVAGDEPSPSDSGAGTTGASVIGTGAD